MLGKWILNILISIDQLANAVLGGDPDETISSRLGKIRISCGGKITWKRPVAKIIDKVLDIIDKDHSIEAIEKDEGKDALIDKLP